MTCLSTKHKSCNTNVVDQNKHKNSHNMETNPKTQNPENWGKLLTTHQIKFKKRNVKIKKWKLTQNV